MGNELHKGVVLRLCKKDAEANVVEAVSGFGGRLERLNAGAYFVQEACGVRRR